MVTRGDDFDDFVRGSSTRLLRTAVLLTGDRAAAEDLVQEMYERVYVRWRRIHSAPEAYARKTLANLAANRWRSRGRKPEVALADHDLATPDGSDGFAVRDQLLTALQELPPRQRAVDRPPVLRGPHRSPDRRSARLLARHREEPDLARPRPAPPDHRTRHPGRTAMTETELKHRLSASVDDIEAPSDLLDRARLGGARRLQPAPFPLPDRHRRRAWPPSAASPVAGAGHLLDRFKRHARLAATPRRQRPVRLPDEGPRPAETWPVTPAYLDQALTAWRTSHRKSANDGRGIFDRHARRTAKVSWAGNTPGGRAAIVGAVLRSAARTTTSSSTVKALHTLDRLRWSTDKDGKPGVVADSYPAPGRRPGHRRSSPRRARPKALVVLDSSARRPAGPPAGPTTSNGRQRRASTRHCASRRRQPSWNSRGTAISATCGISPLPAAGILQPVDRQRRTSTPAPPEQTGDRRTVDRLPRLGVLADDRRTRSSLRGSAATTVPQPPSRRR